MSGVTRFSVGERANRYRLLPILLFLLLVVPCFSQVTMTLGEPVSSGAAAVKAIRLSIQEGSDITITTYSNGVPQTSRPQLTYEPSGDIQSVLNAAGYSVLLGNAPQTGEALLFVDYEERRQNGQEGLDAPTAYSMSYSVSVAGHTIGQGATNSSGCNSIEELKGDPAFANLGALLSNDLAAHAEAAKGIESPVQVSVPLAGIPPTWETGTVFTIPSDVGDVQDVTLSPDLKSVAYVGLKDGNNCLMVNGEVLQRFDVINDMPVFHPSGSVLGYTISRDGFGFVGIGGRTGFSGGIPCGFRWSADGRHYAYVRIDGNRTSMVIDGKIGNDYDSILCTASFSSRGTRRTGRSEAAR